MNEDPYQNAYDDTPHYSDNSNERVPQNSIKSEQGVLSGLLNSADAMAEVLPILKGADFYAPKHETLFNAMFEMYSQGVPINYITVIEYLNKKDTDALKRAGGEEYILSLNADMIQAVSAGYYAQIVAEKAVLRRLAEAGIRIAKMGFDGDGDAVDLVNMAASEIDKVSGPDAGVDYIDLARAVDIATKEIEDAEQAPGGMSGIPTGFRELDEKTNGFHGGQMIIIAARPAMGKSTLALDIARSAAVHHNKTTVFFSLEMSSSEIAQRLISAEGNIHLQDIRKAQNIDWRIMAKVTNDIREKPLFIDDSVNMTLVDIRAKCRRLKQQNNLQMVVIDYLQLLSSGKKSESRQQEVSEFSRALKLLAKELDVPVVALSQLNRASEQRADKMPAMSDLRESGSLEQDADMVILLHRDVAKDSPRAGEADLILAKQRNGPTGTVTVAFQGQYSRFRDIPKEQSFG